MRDNQPNEKEDGGFMRLVSFDSDMSGPERLEHMVVEMARAIIRELVRRDKTHAVCGSVIGDRRLEMTVKLHPPAGKGGAS
jgi:hypothetical protein